MIDLLRRLLQRIPRETLALGTMAAVFLGLAFLGRWIQGSGGVDTFGVFALAGIAGACWGYWWGSAPIRQLRLEWADQVRRPAIVNVQELPRGYGDMRGGSRGTGPRW